MCSFKIHSPLICLCSYILMLHVFEESQLSVSPFGKKFGLEGPMKFLDGHLRPHPAVPCWTEMDRYIEVYYLGLNRSSFVFVEHNFNHYRLFPGQTFFTRLWGHPLVWLITSGPFKWNSASLIILITPETFLLWRVCCEKKEVCLWLKTK